MYKRQVTDIPFSTEIRDLTSSWSGVVFDTPESGYYDIDFSRRFTTSVPGAFLIYKDGSSYLRKEISSSNIIHEGTFNAVYLEKGEQVTFRSESGGTLNNDINHHRLRIAKRASPQTILETETVAARYTSNSGQSIPNASETTVVYEDLDGDTHNAYNTSTGVYTIPVSGWYTLSATGTYASLNRSPGLTWWITIVEGVTTIKTVQEEETGTDTGIVSFDINDIKYYEKGSELQIKLFQNTGLSEPLTTNGTLNVFSIARLK